MQRTVFDARCRRVASLSVAVAALVALAGCGVSKEPGTPETGVPSSSSAPAPSPAPTSPVSPADRAGQEALEAYRGMWRDFVEAGTTSDWQSSLLGRHSTGIALTNLSRGLYADHYNGLVTKGEPILNPAVTSTEPLDDPIKVVVTDCGESTGWLKYRADNGERADGSPGGRRLINAIVEKQSDGSWKVSDYAVRDLGTC